MQSNENGSGLLDTIKTYDDLEYLFTHDKGLAEAQRILEEGYLKWVKKQNKKQGKKRGGGTKA